MIVIGALLIFFSMFLPIIRCESSGGWWTCTRDSISLFDTKAFQDDAEFYEGVLSNFEPINMMAITIIVIGAAVLERGLVPAASTLFLFVMYHLYIASVAVDEETSVDLSLSWGWFPLVIGSGLILAAAIMFAREQQQQEQNVRAYITSRIQQQAEPPASPSEPAQ